MAVVADDNFGAGDEIERVVDAGVAATNIGGRNGGPSMRVVCTRVKTKTM